MVCGKISLPCTTTNDCFCLIQFIQIEIKHENKPKVYLSRYPITLSDIPDLEAK